MGSGGGSVASTHALPPESTGPVPAQTSAPPAAVAPKPSPPKADPPKPAAKAPEAKVPPPKVTPPAAPKPPATPAAAAPTPQPVAAAKPTGKPTSITVPAARVVVVKERSYALEWLFALSMAVVVAPFALRPVRRWITLWHLRRPLWAESVDQRVSNLWQLALVGLRDAGWRTIPGEQPQELARRIGLEGMTACAAVLERARHGVRVDAADLSVMERAAESVYDGARAHVGSLTRAAGWWRWPLV
jgi:hypothetical protein